MANLVEVAFNDVTGHKVAIKIMNKKKIKQQGVFEKIKREIKVLRLFNHPHIIKHYEFIDTPSDIFMVIEFASGGELFELISRRERVSIFDSGVCLTSAFGIRFRMCIFLPFNFCSLKKMKQGDTFSSYIQP